MILLPKQLHTSVSALDTKALDLDSEEFFQTCERSLTWRGRDSRWQTWSRRWKRVNWMRPLFSLTLKHSHTKSFVDSWTSSVAASRANPSVLQESVKALKTHDICSLTSEMGSQSADLDLFSWRTSKGLSPVRRLPEPHFLGMSLKCWNSWVTKQRQEYSQRLKSGQATKESGCSSWAWPTVAAHEARLGYQRRDNGKKGTQKSLTTVVIENGLHAPENFNKSLKNREQLNPAWVEQFMGLPVGWTDLDSLVTE